ncbi:MAG: DUF1648 domain-containing protein [Ruminococcaceae bacterium]|nr:DUF1648 domain-containing protein [Oscillospiraceae bacterium]
MIKRNKLKLLISSITILLPILIGLILWKKLPERMTTHWGFDGNVDGWSSRPFAIFGLPVILLIMQWIFILITVKDPKNKDQNNKAFSLVLWIIPALSLFSCGIVYAVSLGSDVNIGLLVLLLIGLMFVAIGNYLPKCRQNYTIGIKIKWTLENEENWNATHRFGGKVWVFGGLFMMACVFLPERLFPLVVPVLIILLAGLPIIYSYLYHKKQLKEGTAIIKPIPMSKGMKRASVISLVILSAILIFIGFMMFAGEINVKYDDTSFTLEASFWEDLTVEYGAIDDIEYRENVDVGSRTGGLGTTRLLAGAFRNDEFGNYTRYSYTKTDVCVVLTVGEKTLVVGGKDIESTKIIYDELIKRK